MTAEPAPCPMCGSSGAARLRRVRDLFFGSAGEWDIFWCDRDRVAWISPQPTSEQLAQAYSHYYTHASDANGESAGMGAVAKAILQHRFGYAVDGEAAMLTRAIAAVPLVFDTVAGSVMWLEKVEGGRLLDVGCGNGAFLERMQSLGWIVAGVETDPVAASVARSRGLDVTIGELQRVKFSDASFDAITMAHVIEHLRDARALLSECLRILRPGGKLIIATPNVESLGFRLLRERWRGLEVPRHLAIHSVTSLSRLLGDAGFELAEARTVTRGARSWWSESRAALSRHAFGRVRLLIERMTFQVAEESLMLVSATAGEEVLAIAKR